MLSLDGDVVADTGLEDHSAELGWNDHEGWRPVLEQRVSAHSRMTA